MQGTLDFIIRTETRHKPPLRANHLIPSGSDNIPLVSLRRSLVLLGLVQREAVSSLEHVRRIAGAEDVALLALPLGLVDGVDPVLDLHDNAAVLLNHTRAVGLVEQTLGLLESEGTVLAGA